MMLWYERPDNFTETESSVQSRLSKVFPDSVIKKLFAECCDVLTLIVSVCFPPVESLNIISPAKFFGKKYAERSVACGWGIGTIAGLHPEAAMAARMRSDM